MATRPATDPEMAPRAVGLPLCIHSARVQLRAAAAAAKWVATKADVAQRTGGDGTAEALNSEPAHPEKACADEAEDRRGAEAA